MRAHFNWNIGSRQLQLGSRTLVMGIVNVTPDSFSDGGQFYDHDRAVEHAIWLLEQGADIVDIGGESTRPGAAVMESEQGSPCGHGRPRPCNASEARASVITAEEEIARVLPVIERTKRHCPNAIISIDTYKATTARAAVQAGAEIVNDVSGFQWDPQMAETCADLNCGVVLMHMRGLPETWRSLERLEDPLTLVKHELALIAQKAQEDGVAHDRIMLDPGFGFGKNFEENYPLLSGLDQLAELGFPVLAGTSCKSFIGRAMGAAFKPSVGLSGVVIPPSERLSGSLAAMVISIMKGAHIVRVHDVKESVKAARVTDAMMNAGL